MSECRCQTEGCIKCSACNCKYHTDADTCAAGNICIGKRNAEKSGDTCCDTFQTKE